MLALIYLQAWSVLLCKHIYIMMLRGVNTAYGVKGCVSNTVCVRIVTHVVMWFYANIFFLAFIPFFPFLIPQTFSFQPGVMPPVVAFAFGEC